MGDFTAVRDIAYGSGEADIGVCVAACVAIIHGATDGTRKRMGKQDAKAGAV